MLKMALGHTEEVAGAAAAEELLTECAVGLEGHTPGAGLLLASHDVDLDELLAAINDAHPDLPLIGCTVVAPVSSASPYVEGATTLTLFASDVIGFSSGLATDVARDVGRAAAEAVSKAQEGADQPPALAIVTPSMEGLDPVEVSEEIGRVLGPEVPVFGGGAVPDYPMTGNWEGARQIYGTAILTDSLPLLLLSGPLVVSVGVRHGWNVVGRQAVVTRSKGNRVWEIDGAPVVDFYRHYIGAAVEPAIANPLAIYDPETNRHFLRAPIDWDPVEGAATFFGSVPEGSMVQVTTASTEEIIEGARASVADARAGFPAGAFPEAALISACAVRNLLLGTRTGSEVETIMTGIGPGVPVAGFYAYGEFAPLEVKQSARFHNETCVTMLLGT
jgi:hypothetical protein